MSWAEPWWLQLLREQREARFSDLAGSQASLSLPVSDRLLTRLLAVRLPSSVPIKELDLRAIPGNQIEVRLRLSRPSFLPAFTIRLLIERQPELPSSPVLVLRVLSEGTGGFAAKALRYLQSLPPGVSLDGNLLSVNLASLVERYGAEDVLAHLTSLELTTTEGRVVIAASMAVPERTEGAKSI